MKLRFIYTFFISAFIGFIALSNSAGRAGSANQGNTGAPGDEMIGNNPRTCQSCHATGDIQVTMSLSILDADNNPISSYTPNEIYTAKVSIDSAAGPKANGYGFQMVSLFDADNSDVNGWTETGHSDNVQIAAATNTNRVYAEQKGVSDSNEFLIKWQAPETGKGDISFYAAGNGVNGNGASSGDGAVIPQKLTLTEGIISSIQELSSIGIDIQVAPNPVQDQLNLFLTSEKQDEVTFKIINSAGQIFYTKKVQLLVGKQIESIDLSELTTGIYFLQTSTEIAIESQKIVKL